MYFWTTLCYDHRFCLLFSWGVLVILSEGLILEESALKKTLHGCYMAKHS